MRKLIILIGRGPLPKKENDIASYVKAKYCFPDNKEEFVETPFVGEAIIRLHKEKFDQVFILGTSEAMWDILYFHCAAQLSGEEKKNARKNAKKLAKLRENNSLTQDDVQQVADIFSKFLHIDKTVAHIIKLGVDDEELWAIFEILAKKMDLKGHRISFDITHSVRSHPIFFIFSLFFLNSVVEDVQIESFYYGALPLASREEYGGKTPILDIKAYIDLMKWIDAAQAFKRYVDAAPIANLLDKFEGYDELKASMRDFSISMQLNLTESVKRNASKLVEELSRLDARSPKPLLILREHLAFLPELISNKPYDWHSILNLAINHAEHGRLGLAVLSLFEAITYRFADIFHQTGRIQHKLARAVMGWANDHSVLTNRRQQFMQHVSFGADFLNKYDKLKTIRDAIAHEVALSAAVADDIKDLLAYFQKTLPSPQLEHLEKIYEPQKYIDS